MPIVERILNRMDDTREARYERKPYPRFEQFIEDWFQYVNTYDEVDYV